MIRRSVVMGAVAGGAGLAGTGAALLHAQNDASAESSSTALWTLKLERPEGGLLDLATLKGKPLLINFWATWCPPCIKELPEIDRWYRDHRDRGFQALGVAVDQIKPVRDYLARQPLNILIALAGLDGTDLIAQLGNKAGALPFTVMLDSAGQVRHRKLGETSYAELRAWVDAM